MKIKRTWAMPSANTFDISPIHELVVKYVHDCAVIVDPFARNSKIGTITNDLNPQTSAQYHKPGAEFIADLLLTGIIADAALFDPPYSPRQITECYTAAGLTAGMKDTQSAFLYDDVKSGLAQIIKPGGIAICCGWNSVGFGINRGFQMIEILLVSHGGAHNDTIVTVERKQESIFERIE